MNPVKSWCHAALLMLLMHAVSPGQALRAPESLDVPYEPTPSEVVVIMLEKARVGPADVVYDLGCGDGRIVVAAAGRFGARGVGIDLDPMRLREARENAEIARVADRVRFHLGDINDARIGEATVVTSYLLNDVNLSLRPLLFRQLRPGTRVVAHAFHMGDWDPDEIVRHPRARNNVVYLWVVPGSAGGRWEWTTPSDHGELRFVLDVEQEFQFLSARLSAGDGPAVPVKKAELRGSDIVVEAEFQAGDLPAKVTCSGAIHGDTILGTQTWATGADANTLNWLARRDPVDPAGDWEMAVSPRSASLDGCSLTISRESDGNLFAEFGHGGNRERLRHFYRWGACVRFDVPVSESSSTSYTGIVEGNALHGRAVRPDSSVFQWTASRASKWQSAAGGSRRSRRGEHR